MAAPCPISIDALATWIPEGRENVSEILDAGRLTAEEAADVGLREVPVSTVPAPEMATLAARSALARAGADPARVGLVAHAWIYHQGHDFWSPAHYIAHRLGLPAALPIGVQQMSNAGAVALGVAADRLAAGSDDDVAVVTTGDRFTLPGFDRWRTDYAVVYGDAGTAAVLRRGEPATPDGLVLRALAFTTAAEFEEMYRGRDDFSDVPFARDGHLDVRRPKKAYLEIHQGIDRFREVATVKVRETLIKALGEAGVEPGDPRITAVALPRLADSVLTMMYRPALAGVMAREPLVLRESSGHLGAGDMLANLAHIAHTARPDSGDFAVVLGGGGGFTWSCAVVQVP